MKRTLTKGILSASLVASCLVARTSAQVYSQNVGSLNYSTTTNSGPFLQSVTKDGYFVSGNDPAVYFSLTTWQKGPFTVNVTKYVNGLPAGVAAKTCTWITFGNHSISVPRSPQQIAKDGGIGLLIVGLIVASLLLKRGGVQTNPRTA
jgi:hypothetical protein